MVIDFEPKINNPKSTGLYQLTGTSTENLQSSMQAFKCPKEINLWDLVDGFKKYLNKFITVKYSEGD